MCSNSCLTGGESQCARCVGSGLEGTGLVGGSILVSDAGLAKRFFAAASKVIDAPWTMAVGGDLRYEDVEGTRSGMVKFVNWYIGKLHIAAAGDPAVARAFHRVANLLDPPPSLMQPSIALRILKGNLRKPATRH